MSFTLIQGDMFGYPKQSGTILVYAHGVNTKGVMGAGVARIVKERFPDCYEEYADMCGNGRLQPGKFHVYEDPNGEYAVYNLASQDDPGPTAKLGWLITSFVGMLEDMTFMGYREVRLPQIGCGIGGLAWAQVHGVLREISDTTPISVKVFYL